MSMTETLQERLHELDDPDFYLQLIGAAIEETDGDMSRAMEIADAAYDDAEDEESKQEGDVELSLLDFEDEEPTYLDQLERHVNQPGGVMPNGLPPISEENTANIALSETASAAKAKLRKASAETDTDPTPAQKEAANFKKGKLTLNGFDISIENPKGSIRSGTSRTGKEWKVRMPLAYGHFRRLQSSADGEDIDVFLGPSLHSELIFLVDQTKEDGSFDEIKTLMGFLTEDEARQGYLSCYSKGWKGLGNITPMTMPAFREWVESGDTTKPVAQSVRLSFTAEKPTKEAKDSLLDEVIRNGAAAGIAISDLVRRKMKALLKKKFPTSR